MKSSPSEMDMPRKLPLHVRREKTRHGRFVYYFRGEQGGKRIRLPDYGAPGFNEAYRAALAGTPITKTAKTRSGSLKWAIEQYQCSRHFLNLSPDTQTKRSSIFREMIAKSGDRPVGSIRRKDIVSAREARAQRGMGTAGNSFLKAVKPFFAYCVEMEWITEDPAATVDRVSVESVGFHTWTVEEVGQFVDRHPIGTMPYLTLAVLLFTGLRRSDAFQIGRQHIRDGHIDFTPSKTAKTSGVRVRFPVRPELQAAIDAIPNKGTTLIVSSTGQPFKSKNSFGMWFAKRCVEAGVPGRAHGLRKAGATIAAENGATAHELLAIYGWTKLSQAEVYTKTADRARLGESAISKIRIVI